MITVEKIEKKKRVKDLFMLFLDDGQEIEIHGEILMKYGFESGKTLSQSILEEAVAETQYKKGKEAALKHLRSKNRSLNEIQTYLKQRGYSKDTSDEVISFINEYHLADDQIYADDFVSQSVYKGFGELKIRYELRNKGIHGDIIESSIQKHISDEKSYARALEMAKKKYENEPKDEKTKAKIARFLFSKGYKEGTIFKVLEKLA